MTRLSKSLNFQNIPSIQNHIDRVDVTNHQYILHQSIDMDVYFPNQKVSSFYLDWVVSYTVFREQ